VRAAVQVVVSGNYFFPLDDGKKYKEKSSLSIIVSFLNCYGMIGPRKTNGKY